MDEVRDALFSSLTQKNRNEKLDANQLSERTSKNSTPVSRDEASAQLLLVPEHLTEDMVLNFVLR